MTPEEFLEKSARLGFKEKWTKPLGRIDVELHITPQLEKRLKNIERRLAELEARPYYPVLQPLMPSLLNPTSPLYPWITYTQGTSTK